MMGRDIVPSCAKFTTELQTPFLQKTAFSKNKNFVFLPHKRVLEKYTKHPSPIKTTIRQITPKHG